MRPPSTGASSSLRGLIIVNVALLAILAAVTFASRADAQARLRGDYTMVAGTVTGADTGVVYIVDTLAQEMVAYNYNPNSKVLEGIGYRNLAIDSQNVQRRRGK